MSEETEVVTQQNFTTGVQKETIHFQWNISRLQEVLDKSTTYLQKIYLESQDKSKWHLSLHEYPAHTFLVYCELESGTTILTRRALLEVFDIKANGETGTKLKMENDYKQENFFHHKKAVRIAVYENVQSTDGTVTMMGKLTIYNGTKNVDSSPIVSLSSFEKSALLNLQRDMSDLLTTTEGEQFTDVELYIDDGTVLRAHGYILMARSDYFKAMFSSGMMEQRTGKISVEGINGKAMKALIHFLYSGRLNKDWSDSEVLHDFTKAAHRYQIMTLVEFLDANIVKVCEPCSAGELLLLCKTLGMKTAEKGLRQLIKKNLKQFGGEPEFDDLLLLIAKRQKVVK